MFKLDVISCNNGHDMNRIGAAYDPIDNTVVIFDGPGTASAVGYVKVPDRIICLSQIITWSVADVIHGISDNTNIKPEFKEAMIKACLDTEHYLKRRLNDANEVTTGEWIEIDNGDGCIDYKCPVCGDIWTLNDGTPKDNEMYFCPRCAARLDLKEGEQDGSD